MRVRSSSQRWPRRVIVASVLLLTPLGTVRVFNQGVFWTSNVNVTTNGSAVQKSGGCDGCPDAGAVSLSEIGANGGYIEFTPTFNARLFAGLGADRSTATDAAAIRFAFSFWPGGTWDIRESNVYRTEGSYLSGDRFRISVDGGTVTYYRNDTLVFTSAVAATLPLSLDTTFYSSDAGLTSATLVDRGSTSPGGYTAITDTVARAKPALPALGTRGSVVVDPAFGSRILRVTDGASRPSAPNRSFRSPSGTHQNAWSADGRLFYVVSTDGTVIPYSFDSATMSAARLAPSGTGEGGFVLPFVSEPQFSYVNANQIYGVRGATLHTIDAYDFGTGQFTPLLNLDDVVSGLAGTYLGGIGSSSGPNERLCVFFGGTSQDRHYLAIVFDRANPAARVIVDTVASRVNGAPTNITLNFKLHHAFIDRSGRYVLLYPTGTDRAAPRNAAPVYVWDTATNLFTELSSTEALSNGHDALGFATLVNQDCCRTTTWDAAQWQLRSLGTPTQSRDLIVPVLLPKEVYLAEHPSWNNARPDVLLPYVTALYRYGTNTVPWRAWDDEIVAVQTDVPPGTGATVWRFAHHRSAVGKDTDATQIYFWYSPRPNISPDGHWALYTSNWEKTLGTDPGGEAGGSFRQDAFIVELK